MEQQYSSLSMLLSRFMQECGPSSSRVYCFLTQTTNILHVRLVLLLSLSNRRLNSKMQFVDLAKIQYTRHVKGPHSCFHPVKSKPQLMEANMVWKPDKTQRKTSWLCLMVKCTRIRSVL